MAFRAGMGARHLAACAMIREDTLFLSSFLSLSLVWHTRSRASSPLSLASSETRIVALLSLSLSLSLSLFLARYNDPRVNQE